ASGNPYSANDVICCTISSCAAAVIPRAAIPSRSRRSIAAMRSTERLKPMARRSSSASPPVKPATVMAMRSSCSWKSGTPTVRAVHVDALVLPDGRDRLLERGEHAEPEEVDLDEAQVGAVVLVPLDDVAPRHRGGLERHHLVEPAGRDHHAARMLAEMARQALHLAHELDQEPDARRLRIDAAGAELG